VRNVLYNECLVVPYALTMDVWTYIVLWQAGLRGVDESIPQGWTKNSSLGSPCKTGISWDICLKSLLAVFNLWGRSLSLAKMVVIFGNISETLFHSMIYPTESLDVDKQGPDSPGLGVGKRLVVIGCHIVNKSVNSSQSLCVCILVLLKPAFHRLIREWIYTFFCDLT